MSEKQKRAVVVIVCSCLLFCMWIWTHKDRFAWVEDTFWSVNLLIVTIASIVGIAIGLVLLVE